MSERDPLLSPRGLSRAQAAELIARLEAATEGSRELDAAIWLTTLDEDWLSWWDRSGYVRETVARKGQHFGIFVDTGRTPMDKFDYAPHYTTSIDAALTLVPEGWRVDNLQHQREGYWTVAVRDDQPTGTPTRIWCSAATPALALCIAALKARIAP